MTVPVLLFASYAESVGSRRVQLNLDAPCTVGDVVDAVRALPGGGALNDRVLIAVNQRYERDLARLVGETDEIALFPAVSGG